MHECLACGEGPVDGPTLCVDCARVRSDAPAMQRAAAWALSALQRAQRHPGSDPFLLVDGPMGVCTEKITAQGADIAARGHDRVRAMGDVRAFALLARGTMGDVDFSFTPGGRPGHRPGLLVIAGVAGSGDSLVVGHLADAERPTFFQQIPTWLGRGPAAPRPGGLDVSIRRKA